MTHRSWLKLLPANTVKLQYFFAPHRRRLSIAEEIYPNTPQDDEDSSTLRAKSVRYRYPDIVEGDIGRLCGGRVRGLDQFGVDSLDAGNENDSEAIL